MSRGGRSRRPLERPDFSELCEMRQRVAVLYDGNFVPPQSPRDPASPPRMGRAPGMELDVSEAPTTVRSPASVEAQRELGPPTTSDTCFACMMFELKQKESTPPIWGPLAASYLDFMERSRLCKSPITICKRVETEFNKEVYEVTAAHLSDGDEMWPRWTARSIYDHYYTMNHQNPSLIGSLAQRIQFFEASRDALQTHASHVLTTDAVSGERTPVPSVQALDALSKLSRTVSTLWKEYNTAIATLPSTPTQRAPQTSLGLLPLPSDFT